MPKRQSSILPPDILIDDGDTLTLGNISILFLHTPGHTKGTISFFYNDTDGEKICRVGMFGGAGRNTLVPEKYDFDGAREAYFASIERLKKEKVDVFIGNHCWNNDTYGKSKKLLETGINDFVNSEIWQEYLENCKTRMLKKIEKEKSNEM